MQRIFFSCLFFGILSLLSVSCQPELYYGGYSKSESGLYYKLIAFDDDTVKADPYDYVTVEVAYATMDDSIFFRNKSKIQVTKPAYLHAIDECLLFMKRGDSTSFVLNAEDFFTKTLAVQVPSFIDTSMLFKVNIRLLDIQRKADYEMQKKEFLAWIEDFETYEKVFLKNYLTEQDMDTVPLTDGLYKILISEGEGPYPKRGDTLTINYEGKFLNGIFFDSTIKRKHAFEYIVGTEWQLIDGMEQAVRMMKEGEKALFILPSELAFGARGSSNGTIPPYTSVIYEVELGALKSGDTVQAPAIMIDDAVQ